MWWNVKEDKWSGNSVFYSSFKRASFLPSKSWEISPLIEGFVTYGTSEKRNWKTLQHAGWQKMLQEMIVNLIHVPSNYLSLFTVFSQSLWHRALRNMKRVTTPNSSTNIQKSSCTLYTLIYTRPHYLPVSKELINTGLREKGCIGKNEIGKHDTCQCSPMICYLLFLL